MDDDFDPFSSAISSTDLTEEILSDCYQLIVRQEAEVWEILGTKVESFRDKLTECMRSKRVVEGLIAAQIYCTLLKVQGSEAFRVAESSCTRALITFMRFYLTNPLESSNLKRKKRKTGGSEEEDEIWNLFFETLASFYDQLETEEIVEVFVRLASRLVSPVALIFFEKTFKEKKKRMEVLAHVSEELSKICGDGELSKEKSTWFISAMFNLIQEDHEKVLFFLQALLQRSEYSTQTNRQKLIDFTLTVLNKISDEIVIGKLIEFVYTHLILSEKALKRLFGCDLLCNLLIFQFNKVGNYKYILEALNMRTKDMIPSVRCAALRSISQLVLKRPYILLEDEEKLLNAALEAASFDEKPVVRKFGIKVVALCPTAHARVMEVCSARCRDHSIVVKKAALEALGSFVVRYPHSSGKDFSRGILPLIRDEERSVSDTAVSILNDVIVRNQDIKSVWNLVYEIRSEFEFDCLKIALKEISTREESAATFREFISRVVQEAMNSLPNENEEVQQETLWGVWLILEHSLDRLPSSKVLSNEFAYHAWQSVTRLLSLREDNEKIGVFEAHALQRRVVKLLGGIASRMSLELKMNLSNEFLADLANLDRPPEVVNEMIQTLIKLCSYVDDTNKTTEVIREWAQYLKSVCEKTLKSIESSRQMGTLEEESKLDNALFLVGELALLGFNPDKIHGQLVPFDTNESIVVLIQALTSPDFVRRSTETITSSSTRAFAFLTLGKLCLCDFALAKRCVVVFVKELNEFKLHKKQNHEAVRCNSLIILGDLCRRYTNLVEAHIDQISKSLGDPSSSVRKLCLLTLAGLIQEDYVRLKPNLFYRFLASMGDNSEIVSQAAEYCLQNFSLKNSTIYHLHASSVIFALCGLERNRFKFHHDEDQANAEDASKIGENTSVLVGIQNEFLKSHEKRDELYQFVFSRLDEAQKLEICNKIRRDVFGGLLDGTLGLDHFDLTVEFPSEITRVVMDAFHLLESDYARPFKKQSVIHENEEGEDLQENQESNPIQRATAKIIDSLERKNILENIIPMMVSLYSVASRERSNLAKLVIEHIKYLYQRYPEESVTALTPHREVLGLIQLQLKKNTSSKLDHSQRGIPLKQITNSHPDINNKADLKKVKTPKLLRKVRTAMKE